VPVLPNRSSQWTLDREEFTRENSLAELTGTGGVCVCCSPGFDGAQIALRWLESSMRRGTSEKGTSAETPKHSKSLIQDPAQCARLLVIVVQGG
jgi:hypothetical protein